MNGVICSRDRYDDAAHGWQGEKARMPTTRFTIAGVALLFLAPLSESPHAFGQGLPCPPVQLQRIISPCSVGNGFGRALSVRDDRLAVGRYDGPGGRISTYRLNANTRQWDFETDLRPVELMPGDAFGNEVALHHDPGTDEWLLAGASPYYSLVEQSAGKVYLFRLNGSGEWVAHGELAPDTPVAKEWFGDEVTWATDGGRTFVVVGAPGSEGRELIGSTYVFEEDGQGGWIQQAHLQAPDGSADDAFGVGLASTESNGETILIVGASGRQYVRYTQPGQVYCYRFDSQTDEWMLEAQFEAPDPYEQDRYGCDVSVAPVFDLPGFTHRALVGRLHEGGFGNPEGPGGAYLYLRAADGTWQQEAHLTPPVANPSDMYFGQTVDLASDGSGRLLIGAPNNRDFGTSCGAVYVFERDEQTGEWAATQALYGRESDALDVVGVSLGLGSLASDGLAVLGAHTTQCEGGLQTDAVGAVYSFDLNPGNGGECPAPVITLQKLPDCSSGPGGEIEVRWFQATPDQRARIALLYAKRTGNFIIPNGNPCSGTSLQLGQLGLQVAYVGSAGQFGAGRLKRTVPRTVCGGYLQLVDITRCATSNVVRIE